MHGHSQGKLSLKHKASVGFAGRMRKIETVLYDVQDICEGRGRIKFGLLQEINHPCSPGDYEAREELYTLS